MSPADREACSHLLFGARRDHRWLPALPEALRPLDMADAYAIQNLVLDKWGPVAAWKVGAGSPEAPPACAAIAGLTLFDSGAELDAGSFNVIGIEAEIAYRFDRDLPARQTIYTPDEVMAAVGSVHPAIEISDTRFAVWASQDRLSQIADQLNHGALMVGAGRRDWQVIDPPRQRATVAVNGVPRANVVGGNPSKDLRRLLVWLANEGARARGGIRAGTVVTTGSMTGVLFVESPAAIAVELPGLGTVAVSIGVAS
jgi:2-keto-4-pentenoate hydratase